MRTVGPQRLPRTALALILLLPACSPPEEVVTKPAPKITASFKDETAPILDAYRSMWAEYAKAALTSNLDAPGLKNHAAEDALKLITEGLQGARDRGVVSKGQPVLSPKVVDYTAKKANIEDCADGRDWLEYTADGQPADDEPGGFRQIKAQLKLVKGTWYVTWLQVQRLGTC